MLILMMKKIGQINYRFLIFIYNKREENKIKMSDVDPYGEEDWQINSQFSNFIYNKK